jgi:hypothetical protein
MTSVLDATDTKRRVRRALSEDGLAEIAAGIIFVSAGFYFAAGKFTGAPVVMSPAIAAAMALGAAAVIRRRLIYPRVGFAKPRTGRAELAAIVITVGLLVSAVSAFLVFGRRGGPIHVDDLYLTALRAVGLGAAVSAGVVAWRTGLARFYLYAAAFIACSGGAWLLGPPRDVQVFLAMGVPGLAMVILGGVALARFLRRHPKPASAEAPDGDARS